MTTKVAIHPPCPYCRESVYVEPSTEGNGGSVNRPFMIKHRCENVDFVVCAKVAEDCVDAWVGLNG